MKNNLDTPVAKQCRALYTKMSKYAVTLNTGKRVAIKNGPQEDKSRAQITKNIHTQRLFLSVL